MSSAKHDKHAYDAIFNCEVQFYAGTNFLTTIRLQGHVFWAGKTQYNDDTGVLRAFYQKWSQKTPAR